MTTPSPQRLLPPAWVERIFDRMQGNYGSIWLDRWRTGEIVQGVDRGMLNAKATWAEGLAGFADQPDCIKAAMAACWSKPLPPTLPEFLDMCRQASQAKPVKALPAPELTPEQIAGRKAAASREVRRLATHQVGNKNWARTLRERYLRGEKLYLSSIESAEKVFNEKWRDGKCIPVERTAA